MCGAPCSEVPLRQQARATARHIPPSTRCRATITTRNRAFEKLQIERPAGTNHVSNTSWTQVPEKPRPVPTSVEAPGRSQDHSSPSACGVQTAQRVDPQTMSSGDRGWLKENTTTSARRQSVRGRRDFLLELRSQTLERRCQVPQPQYRLPSSPSTKRRWRSVKTLGLCPRRWSVRSDEVDGYRGALRMMPGTGVLDSRTVVAP
jgi:hypothetical protein